ncbi:MAG TPA: BolA/IbaG family iron-sulfur metabolism protein, partial [Mizugakiibacter sp.]|nr:BolA/IbaG family iron-sulfur metabolism protein [Mizugakiibacter sp.]
GHSPIQIHRAIYAALGPLMETDIHALAIEILPPPKSTENSLLITFSGR